MDNNDAPPTCSSTRSRKSAGSMPSARRRSFVTGRSNLGSSRSTPSLRSDVSWDSIWNTPRQNSGNPWGLPRPSHKSPLRTSLLDLKTSNIEKHRRWSKLCRSRKNINRSHTSFDLDGDGFVGSEDLKLAKALDVQNVGMLDAEGTLKGRTSISKKWFQENQKRMWLFGPSYEGKSIEQNTDELVNDRHFALKYKQLTTRSRALDSRSSHKVVGCLSWDDKHDSPQGPHGRDNFMVATSPIGETGGGEMRRCRTRSELRQQRLKQLIDAGHQVCRKIDSMRPVFNCKNVAVADFKVKSPLDQTLGRDRVMNPPIFNTATVQRA